MTDPTERLAKALQETHGPMCTCPEELMRTICSSCTAERFTTKGFGHRDDHVRAFAEWMIDTKEDVPGLLSLTATYLVSLAAKEEDYNDWVGNSMPLSSLINVEPEEGVE